MKSILALAAVAAAAFSLSATVEAGHRKHYRSYVVIEVIEKPVYETRRVYRYKKETHETVRANAADPAGNYAAYPDWARAALAGHGRRR